MQWSCLLNIIFVFGLIFTVDLSAQSYLLSLPDDAETFNRRIALFANNDILIADSSDDGIFTISNGKVFLTRIDKCGNVVWSNSYERSTEYLEFKDVVIGKNEVIFAYGSAYRGGQEMLFLLKVDQDGNLLNFKLIQTGTIDHFSYSMDIKDGVIMLYGLLLDFETQKEGFISIFDEGLQHKWGKHFAPFESEGDALIDSQGRFICRSGPFHYAFDPEGKLVWAKEVLLDNSALPVSGPCEVSGGFIFEAYRDQQIFFYKLDYDGNLIWKSNKITAAKFGADISARADGNITVLYKQAMGSENVLSRLDLNNSNGQILQHQYLEIEHSIDVDHLYSSRDHLGNIRVLGNKVLLERYSIDIPYFLFQFPVEGQEENNGCYQWNDLNINSPNEIPLRLSDIDTMIPDTRMMVLNTEGMTLVQDYEFPVQDICGLIVDPEIIVSDTLLECDQEWKISLPASDLIWEDLGNNADRILKNSGTYRASNHDCREPKIHEYVLSKPDCTCEVYLPNAISANGDQLNDVFEIYSDCIVQQVHLTVFNRWGVKVYEGNSVWNGRNLNGDLEQGTYIIKVDYILTDTNGQTQEGSQTQEVILIR
ncbi:MAG: gliding motility-associated C-terminal domain-containing protein [Saprospiraceae bacterium]|nr:gliding motility-associated C-terminal domain-containing protein [Saprospiraceae bacterium]